MVTRNAATEPECLPQGMMQASTVGYALRSSGLIRWFVRYNNWLSTVKKCPLFATAGRPPAAWRQCHGKNTHGLPDITDDNPVVVSWHGQQETFSKNLSGVFTRVPTKHLQNGFVWFGWGFAVAESTVSS